MKILNSKFSAIWYFKKYKIIFVSIPKNASTFFLNSLIFNQEKKSGNNKFNFSLTDSGDHLKLPYVGFKFLFITNYYYLLNKRAKYKFVTVVRNPYTRVFSAWADKILLCDPYFFKDYKNLCCKAFCGSTKEIKNSFEFFLEYLYSEGLKSDDFNVHWMPQHLFLDYKNLDYFYIGKYEKLDQVIKFFNKFNLNLSPSTIKNDSFIKYESRFISKRSKFLIKKIYKDDFKYFNYSQPPPKSFRKQNIKEIQMLVELQRKNNIQYSNNISFKSLLLFLINSLLIKLKKVLKNLL